ncbi:MAG TPA: M67 family metallopeptidase [Anaerolineales bacterium]|nr:M67 family metallopeptidase [Anaerolineales bacterium]
MIARLLLNEALLQEMIAYVEEHAPLEACGVLAGTETRAEKMIGVLNQAQSRVRFVMEPYEQLRAFDWIEANGLDLVGIFHSHPAGPETASATDILEAAYDVVHVILSRSGTQWRARGFWIEDGKASEVALQIDD